MPTSMTYRQCLLRESHTWVARACWLVTLSIASAGIAACGSEPCSYGDTVAVDPQTTPFADGASVFSKCGACPSLPKMDGIDASGPATVCDVEFHDSGPSSAWVNCFYGPGGNTSSSIANGAVTDVPNLFDYCEAHCPDHDALHACQFRSNADGVESFSCWYGQTCG